MNGNQFAWLLVTGIIGAAVSAANLYQTRWIETRKQRATERDFLKGKRQEAYAKYWAARSNWVAAQSVFEQVAQAVREHPNETTQEMYSTGITALNTATNEIRAAGLEAMIVGSAEIRRYVEDELDTVNGIASFYYLTSRPGCNIDAVTIRYRGTIERLHGMGLHSPEFVDRARRDLDTTDT